jgi:hypothetical protein
MKSNALSPNFEKKKSPAVQFIIIIFIPPAALKIWSLISEFVAQF